MSLTGRVGSLLLIVGVTLTACAGTEVDQASSELGDTVVSDQLGTEPVGTDVDTDVDVDADADADVDADADGADAAHGDDAPAVRRVLPLSLRPESDLPTNLLPSVEVHDVLQDRTVNFRNIFPADRPVLLWMWAPY